MAGERPKRPLSAYMLWLNEHREQIKKENPGSKVTDIAKRGGELWRAIKDKTVSTQNWNCGYRLFWKVEGGRFYS